MKKGIVLFALVALICALLCGCTPPKTETGLTEQNTGLPALQTGQQPRNTEPGAQGQDTRTPDTELTVDNTGDPTGDPVPETEEDTDSEIVSDYVVEGGDGFGFGGN